MKKKTAAVLLGAAVLTAAGYPYHLELTHYTVYSPKIRNAVKAVILSDLHGSSYGTKNAELIRMVRGEKPDFILLPGDLFDEFNGDESAWNLLKGLEGLPMYYAMGNHEMKREDYPLLVKRMKLYGVHTLDCSSTVLKVGETPFEIGGIPSRWFEEDFTAEEVNAVFSMPFYRILLAHRPHWKKLYEQIHTDLIVSGHAHGGQWRIPFTSIGLGAPQQGIIPKFTEGRHAVGEALLLISRGLCRTYHYLPRLFNNPEVVSVTFLPDDTEKLIYEEGKKYAEKVSAGTESI